MLTFLIFRAFLSFLILLDKSYHYLSSREGSKTLKLVVLHQNQLRIGFKIEDGVMLLHVGARAFCPTENMLSAFALC